MPYVDVYYSPEAQGLRIVAELEDPDACYSFDKIVVWENQAGEFFWASDSGCSCPSPFESIACEADMTRLTPQSMPQFIDAVGKHCDDSYARSNSPEHATTKQEFLRKVREAMR